MKKKINKQVKAKIKQLERIDFDYFSISRQKRLKVFSILCKISLTILFFLLIGALLLALTLLISIYVIDKNKDVLLTIGYSFFGVSISIFLGIFVAIRIGLGSSNEYFNKTESTLFFRIKWLQFIDNALLSVYSALYSLGGLVFLFCSQYIESIVYPIVSIVSSIILLIRYINYSRKNKYERFKYYLLHSPDYQKTSPKEVISDHNLMLRVTKDTDIDFKKLYSFLTKRVHHINYYIDDLEEMFSHDEDVSKEQNILEDFFIWYSKRIKTPFQFFSLVVSIQAYLELLIKHYSNDKCKHINTTVKNVESILYQLSLVSNDDFLHISIAFHNLPLELDCLSNVNQCVFNIGKKILMIQNTYVSAYGLLVNVVTKFQSSLGISINYIDVLNEKRDIIKATVNSNLNSIEELANNEETLLDQSVKFLNHLLDGDYKLEVLVPTHHKLKEEVLEMIKKCNVKSQVLVCNQGNSDSNTRIDNIHLVNVSNVGVSNNRNNLLNYAEGDICICIDDDCRLVDNYVDIVDNFFKEHPDVEFILFNGIVTKENNRLIHNKKTKRVTRFNDISYGGGPGLVFRRDAISKYDLKYDTSVGYPNYICLGEDTLFLYNLVKSKAVVYRSDEVLFSIEDDVDNSIYFKGVDESFLISKGYIASIIHPHLKRLYVVKYALHLRHWRGNTQPLFQLIKKMNKGFNIKNDYF